MRIRLNEYKMGESFMMMMIDGISLLYIEASIHVRPWGMSIEREKEIETEQW